MGTLENDEDGSPGEDGSAYELRSYGRRRGRKLSPRQDRLMRELLPRIAVDVASPPPASVASLSGDEASRFRETWLEIGFGGGEHLLWQARHNPAVRIIGAEPFEDGVVKVLAAVEEEGLGNVRLHADDARTLLRWLPPASISRAFILFPDPWPKRRHTKRRLVNPGLIQLLARVLAPGAELRIATDIGDYARTILMAFQTTDAFVWSATRAADWRQRTEDWPPTRYEAKAEREGRRSCYLRFLRR